jgi:hypothetical protein
MVTPRLLDSQTPRRFLAVSPVHPLSHSFFIDPGLFVTPRLSDSATVRDSELRTFFSSQIALRFIRATALPRYGTGKATCDHLRYSCVSEKESDP